MIELKNWKSNFMNKCKIKLKYRIKNYKKKTNR